MRREQGREPNPAVGRQRKSGKSYKGNHTRCSCLKERGGGGGGGGGVTHHQQFLHRNRGGGGHLAVSISPQGLQVCRGRVRRLLRRPSARRKHGRHIGVSASRSESPSSRSGCDGFRSVANVCAREGRRWTDQIRSGGIAVRRKQTN